VLTESIDALHFERNAVDEDELLLDADAVDLVGGGTLREDAVVHEGIRTTVLGVVDVYYQGVVGTGRPKQLVLLQSAQLEPHLRKLYHLTQPCLQRHVYHVVVFVWGVEHGWHVVLVPLFIDARIDPYHAIHTRIHFERDAQPIALHLHSQRVLVQVHLQIEVLQRLITHPPVHLMVHGGVHVLVELVVHELGSRIRSWGLLVTRLVVVWLRRLGLLHTRPLRR